MKKTVFGIKAIALVMLTVFGGTQTIAQQNKVENGSFEELEGKIKAKGQFTTAVLDWEDPRESAPADIYSMTVKKGDVAAPINPRGNVEPWDGDNMAGILAYSERAASPRQYLASKLGDGLIAGRKYCVKFNIFLSQISKYACSDIGVSISASRLKQEDIDEAAVSPQVLPLGTGIYKSQGEWQTVCQEFTADGTEKYIVIGNFAPQSEVNTMKMRRPSEFKQLQTRDAYYFIDDVSVILTDHLDSPCICMEAEEGGGAEELHVVYKHNVSTDAEMSAADKLSHKKLHYKSGISDLTESHRLGIDDVIDVLRMDPNIRISINGHADSEESEMYSFDIAQKRADAVKTYMISKGISSDRLRAVSYKSTNPSAGGSSAQSNAQNRRVEFTVD